MMKPSRIVAAIALSVIAGMAALTVTLLAATTVFEADHEGQIWQTLAHFDENDNELFGQESIDRCHELYAAGPPTCDPLNPDDLNQPQGVGVFDPGGEVGATARRNAYRVYVADTFNHRIIGFNYDGVHQNTFADRARADLNALVTESGHLTIDRDTEAFTEENPGAVTFPDGVTADSAGNVLVSDTYGGRVVVYSPGNAGTPNQYQFHKTMPPDGFVFDGQGNVIGFDPEDADARRTRGNRAWPSQIAVRPGIEVLDPASAQCSTEGRTDAAIAVSTWMPYYSVSEDPDADPIFSVLTYDDDGNLINEYRQPDVDPANDPAAFQRAAYGMNSVLVYDRCFNLLQALGNPRTVYLEQEAVAGEFEAPDQVAWDPDGKLLVADLPSHNVQVFEPQVNPAQPINPEPILVIDSSRCEWLNPVPADRVCSVNGPYGAIFDSLGRIVVSDTGNNRLAIFRPDYLENDADDNSTLLFELKGRQEGEEDSGGLAGYPHIIVQDKYGRYIVVVSLNDRVQVFDVPMLAAYDQSARTTTGQAVSSLAGNQNFTVTFSLVVPEGKATRTRVLPSLSWDGPVQYRTVFIDHDDNDATAAVSILGGPVPADWAGTLIDHDLNSGTADQIVYQKAGETWTAPYELSLDALDVATYTYHLNVIGVTPDPPTVTFTLGGADNGGGTDQDGNAVSVVAPSKFLTIPIVCETCNTQPPTIQAQETEDPLTVLTDPWVQQNVPFVLRATDAATGDNGVRRIFYRFPEGGGAEAAERPNLTGEEHTWTSACPRDGLPCFVVDVPGGGTAEPFTADVFFESSGVNTIQFWAEDGLGNISPANEVQSLNLTVRRPPTATSVTRTVAEDSSIDINVGELGSHPDGTAFGQTVSSPAVEYGTLIPKVGGPAGWYTYTPPADFFTPTGGPHVTFTHTLTDSPYGLTSQGTVTVVVTPVNDAPVAVDDAVTTSEETPITFAVLTNDDDGGGSLEIDALRVGDYVNPSDGDGVSRGTLVRNPDWTFTYTPPANWTGEATFTYQASDGSAMDTATVTITVTDTDDAPTAVNDVVDIDEDADETDLRVLNNDSHPDDDLLTLAIVTAPTKGVARIVNNAILYDSTLNANGNDSLQYRVTDESGDTATANVVIRIRPMPDTPTATDDSRTIPEDSAITIAVLENDIDPDRPGSIAGLGIRSFTPPRNASTNAVTGTLVRHGENTPGSADDTFTWTPPANFNGTVTFQYTIANADGGVDSATVTIVVSPGNDAPVGNDAAFTTAEDTAYSGQLTGSDLDGDTLTFSRTTLPLHGTVTVNANGSYTYTPATDYNGSDSFTATVSDGNGGSDLITVTITVTPVNDLPVAFVDTGTTAEDTPITINVITNDTSGDGSLTIAATVPPPAASGTIAVVGSSITFTPALNFLGDVSFSYRVTDPDGDASNANVDIRVTAANDAPTVVDDTATTPEDTAINIAVLGNDTDVDGDTLDVTSVTQPASGGSVSLNANDTVRFVPVADFSGTVTFTYTATDGTVSRTATVTVTVTPVNDPPTAQPDSYSVVEGQTLVVPAPGVLVNDSDVDDTTLTAARVSSPSRGTLTLLANGGFTYESTLGYIGPVTFTYDAVDDDGLTAQATVTITVLTRNTAPICSAATASPSTLWPPNHRVIDPIAITGVTDADGDAVTITVKYIWQDEPTNTLGDGDFAIDGFGVGTDTPSVRRERQGTRSTPPGDGRVYEIGFEAVDTKGGSCTGSVMVGIPHDQGQLSTPIDSVCRWDSTIANGPVLNACAGGGAPSNQAPTVSASNQTTQAGTAASVQISGSDPEGLTLTWGATGLPPGLTIGATGLITGTPLPAGVGEHQVTVNATDPNGASGSASFTWTITAANQLPTGVTDSYEASAGETLQVAAPGVLGNDSDMDGDDLTAVLVSGPASGTLTLNPDGSFSYVPAPGFSGDATFTYRSRDDNEGESDPVTVTIAVTAPLVAENDQYVASAGTVLNVAAPGVLGNDEVPTGAGEASVAVVSDPANGSVVLQTNGAFAYTPPANYGGTVTFTYRITRGAQTSNTATVSIRVNRPPTAVADTYTVEGNTTLTVSGEGVLGNDSDPDGGMLTAEIAQAASNGTVSLSANGSFTYTPANGFVGTATFAYRAVDDDDAESESTTVTITVTATAPTAAADTYSTRTNLALTTAAPGVLGNDENPAGGAMTAEVVTNPANGTVALQANGGFTYTPEDGFTGTDTFTYRAVVGETESAPATVTLTVTATPPAGAKVRRETYFNSTSIVEGSVHIMNAVNIAFNGTSTLTGDLLVQGMPTIQVNGTVNYEGTIDGGGAATPATRIITLNAGTTVGHVVRRTDPEAWPTIANPSTTYGGTRAVTLNSNGDSPGDFGTLRDLTINQSGRQVAVPAGTYRTFTANSGSVFVLGVAGATEASVYDFQNLRLNGGSRIEVVGPVIVTVRNAMTPTGSIGSAARPDWLTLRVTTGNLELTNNMSLYGYVFVPTRTVVINGGTQLIGTVLADRLTLNSNARLTLLP